MLLVHNSYRLKSLGLMKYFFSFGIGIIVATCLIISA